MMEELNYLELPPVHRNQPLYQQYVPPGDPATEPAARGANEIPSSAEVIQLLAEVEVFRNEAQARESQLRKNLEVVELWLQRNEKPVVPATSVVISAPPTASPTIGSSQSPNVMKLDKRTNIKRKPKLRRKVPTSLSPQLKKKRKREREGEGDSLEAEKERQGPVLSRKTDDVENTPTSPPPPAVTALPLAQPILKGPSRSSTPKLPKPKAAKGAAEKMKVKQKKRGKMEADDSHPGAGDDRKDESQATVEGDYSKAKAPPNQIPITQFWSFCDQQFFRPLQDEDFAFLDSKGDEITPFIVPLLGRSFIDQFEEEALMMDPLSKPNAPRDNEEVEENYGEGVSLGAFTQRVLSSLQEESLQMLVTDFDTNAENNFAPQLRLPPEMMMLDERLKNEMRFLGLLGDEEVFEILQCF
ncbi:hypothetical protein BC829DRAFT_382661 [Chytridium lagenaria]|nr:hypothetical protein BC829DRAFT_382661 [Chytridium lagenaria]